MPTSKHTTSNGPGIYRFVCAMNGKCYVGSSIHVVTRRCEHLAELRANRHQSQKFQNSWNKYGEAAFRWEVLEYIAADDLVIREQFWIDHFRAADKAHGFNNHPASGSPRGIKRSEETKEKMRIAARARKTRPFSAEHRANLSKALKGNQRTKDHKLSDEHKAKLSLASKGKGKPWLVAYWTGRSRPVEFIARLTASRQMKRRRVGPGESQGMLF